MSRALAIVEICSCSIHKLESTRYFIESLSRLSDVWVVFRNNISKEYCVNLMDVVQGFRKYDDVYPARHIINELYENSILCQYSELIISNTNLFGPFYNLKDLFEKMEGKNVDYWGISNFRIFNEGTGDSYNTISPFFIVFREKLLRADIFKEFWKRDMSKEFAIGGIYEQIITTYLDGFGYKWGTLINTDYINESNSEKFTLLYLLYNQIDLIKRGSPFMFIEWYNIDFSHILKYNNGVDVRKSLEYVSNHYSYNINLIYKFLVHSFDTYDLHNYLCLSKIFSLDSLLCSKMRLENIKAVVVFHFYYTDGVEKVCSFLKNIPEPVDLIVTTNTEEKEKLIIQNIGKQLGSRLTVIRAPPVGRDLAALLVSAKSLVKKYDYFCFTHDKKSSQVGPYSVGAAFQDLIIENVIGSREYILNVLFYLVNNPFIGLLCVPYPKMGIYYLLEGDGWCDDYEGTVQLAKELTLNAIIDRNKQPLAMGTSFWCRTDALLPLLNADWEGKFVPEPMPSDGTISHCLERILPYVAQSQGYLTATIQNSKYAEEEYVRLNYFLYELTKSLRQIDDMKNYPNYSDFESRVSQLSELNSNSMQYNLSRILMKLRR